jgi:hypothetical protein
VCQAQFSERRGTPFFDLRLAKVKVVAVVERNNGTAGHFNARKQRDTYCFSEQLSELEAMSWLMLTHYNFWRANRPLRVHPWAVEAREKKPGRKNSLARRLRLLIRR